MADYVLVLNQTAEKVRAHQQVPRTDVKYLMNCAFVWRDSPYVEEFIRSQGSAASSAAASSATASNKRSRAVAEGELSPESLMLCRQSMQPWLKTKSDVSCHELAIALQDTLCQGGPVFTRSRPHPSAAAAAAGEAADYQGSAAGWFLRFAAGVAASHTECCIRIRTWAHSFVVIVSNGAVNSLEGYSGHPGMALDQRALTMLPALTVAQCAAAIRDLLNPDNNVRNAAFGHLSSCAPPGAGYFNELAISELQIEIKNLKKPEEFGRAAELLLTRTARFAKYLLNAPSASSRPKR